jgi:hypothetical protein
MQDVIIRHIPPLLVSHVHVKLETEQKIKLKSRNTN